MTERDMRVAKRILKTLDELDRIEEAIKSAGKEPSPIFRLTYQQILDRFDGKHMENFLKEKVEK